jgi:hypothetical protein
VKKNKRTKILWDGAEVERLRQVRRQIQRDYKTREGLYDLLERLEKVPKDEIGQFVREEEERLRKAKTGRHRKHASISPRRPAEKSRTRAS